MKTLRSALQTAFTLVEMLVGLGIVLTLAMLLIPAFSHGIGSAQQARCAQNLRQIGLGIQQYAQDNDGKIVPWRADTWQNWTQYWVALLSPYVGLGSWQSQPAGGRATSVYMCPTKKANSKGLTETTLGNYRMRYNINLHIAENAPGLSNPSVFRSVRLNRVQPSKTYIVMDLFGDGGGGFWCTTNNELTYPHNDRINVLFLDNHVEALDRERMAFLGARPYHVFWRGYDWGYGGYSEE